MCHGFIRCWWRYQRWRRACVSVAYKQFIHTHMELSRLNIRINWQRGDAGWWCEWKSTALAVHYSPHVDIGGKSAGRSRRLMLRMHGEVSGVESPINVGNASRDRRRGAAIQCWRRQQSTLVVLYPANSAKFLFIGTLLRYNFFCKIKAMSCARSEGGCNGAWAQDPIVMARKVPTVQLQNAGRGEGGVHEAPYPTIWQGRPHDSTLEFRVDCDENDTSQWS